MFRLPTDPEGFGERFYQREYRSGATSLYPLPPVLRQLVESRFAGSDLDCSPRIDVLEALDPRPGSVVIDFGASWGYCVWQLRRRGYNAIGYEISRPRAHYARRMLDVPMATSVDELPRGVDVFFSSHVIEHIPAPGAVFAIAQRCLRPGGLFVAFTPNGCAPRRALPEQALNVARMWGLVHPIVLDDVFYAHAFRGYPRLLATTPYPYDIIRTWDRRTDTTSDLSGGELLIVVVFGAPDAG